MVRPATRTSRVDGVRGCFRLAGLLIGAHASSDCLCTGVVVSPPMEITVSNATDGTPINDATVTAVDPEARHITATPTLASDATDAFTPGDGGSSGTRYVFWNGAGQYTVTVSRPGFQTVIRALTATTEGGCGGRTSRFAIALTPQ